MIAALHSNVFITGLNQLSDIEIDKVNKPYLPLVCCANEYPTHHALHLLATDVNDCWLQASGDFSVGFGIAVVTVHGIASVAIATGFGTTPLLYTVLASNVLGVMYSLSCGGLPYCCRCKRYPTVAAGFIVIVRSMLVQIGFHNHLRAVLGRWTLTPWEDNQKLLFSVVFFLAMGVVIALFKDVPDIRGDKKAKIKTYAAAWGAAYVVNLCARLVALAFSGAVVYWVTQESHYLVAAGHALAGWWLRRKLLATEVEGDDAPKSIRSSYMAIWQIFFAEYLLLILSLY